MLVGNNTPTTNNSISGNQINAILNLFDIVLIPQSTYLGIEPPPKNRLKMLVNRGRWDMASNLACWAAEDTPHHT